MARSGSAGRAPTPPPRHPWACHKDLRRGKAGAASFGSGAEPNRPTRQILGTSPRMTTRRGGIPHPPPRVAGMARIADATVFASLDRRCGTTARKLVGVADPRDRPEDDAATLRAPLRPPSGVAGTTKVCGGAREVRSRHATRFSANRSAMFFDRGLYQSAIETPQRRHVGRPSDDGPTVGWVDDGEAVMAADVE